MYDARLIVFDLDGTLVDSVPDLTWAVDGAMAALDLPARGRDKVAVWVGNGMDSLLHRAITDSMDGQAPEDQLATAREQFIRLYSDHFAVASRAYDGAIDCLEALTAAGKRCAIVTNKPIGFTEPLLATLGLRGYFGAVLGGDSLAVRKPDPEPLFHAARLLDPAASAADLLMVGDSSNDIAAARNAGIPVIATDYGYNHGRDIRDHRPDAVIASLRELPPLLGLAPV